MGSIITLNFKNGKRVTSIHMMDSKREKGLKIELIDLRKEMKVNNKNIMVLKVTLKTSHKNEHH